MASTLDFHLGSPAYGTKGLLGPLIALVVDPVSHRATHLVIRNGDVPETGRVVPIRHVSTASESRIELGLDRRRFFDLPRFIVPYSLDDSKVSTGPPVAGVRSPGRYTFAVHEQIPVGRVTIDARTRAVDERGDAIGIAALWSVDRFSQQIVGLSVRPTHGGRHSGRIFFDGEIIVGLTASRVTLRLGSSGERADG